MLPLAWFYIALVVFSYALLLYLELRSRAKRHVKGCPSLPYISPARLDSLIAIEPDLFIVELSSRATSCQILQIPDALRMPVSQVESFLRKAPRRSVFVFYDSATDPVKWSRVESILNSYAIPNVFVLKGGLELWLSKHRADGMAVASWIAGRKAIELGQADCRGRHSEAALRPRSRVTRWFAQETALQPVSIGRIQASL